MSTHLLEIAKKAEVDKTYRFQDLSRELKEEFLQDCWKTIRRDAACGVDHVTVADYQSHLKENLQDLVTRLKEGRYRARLIRRKWIPKGTDPTRRRPLGIPVTEDKVLQKAVARILELIWEPQFYRLSYGYRPGRGARDAVRFLTRKLQFGRYKWVVEADLRSYFDSLSHEWLIKMLERRIDDRRFLRLIRKWLKAGVLEEDGQITRPDAGSPQGGIVSPVLANIYLHHVLDAWFMREYRKSCRGETALVRYADDFVAAFEHEADARRFRIELEERLKKFGLTLAEEKTRVIPFHRRDPEECFEFLGFEFRWGKDHKKRPQSETVAPGAAEPLMRPHLKRRTAPRKFRAALQRIAAWCRENRHRTAKEFFGLLSAKLRGHYSYYGVSGNGQKLKSFFQRTLWYAWRWLRRRNSRGKMTWDGFRARLDYYRILPPRITERARAGA
ncbi:MAG: group II intron reverse transcriptase/maturase [Elusimicrobia bacterium]|nr:group II intron reverse transcriptase/maturase [Elusimicrobiota bacterium]